MKQRLTILFLFGIFVRQNSFSSCNNIGKPQTINSDTSKLTKFPKSIGFINDFENNFSIEQIAELDSIIKSFRNITTNEIAIVSIESIEPYKDFADYSLDLFNTWGIGRADTDNGLLIIFSVKLRQVRISTGKGTEKILSDVICKKVLDDKILPNFKNSLYYEGIKDGLIELISLWNKK